jgi:hypothetical protein
MAKRKPEPIENKAFQLEAGVSLFDGKPFVILRWDEKATQMTPGTARETAIAFLEAAEAAEHDAGLCDWLMKEMGMPNDAAAAALAHIRQYRVDRLQS